MSQLLTYEDYINFLIDEVKVRHLDVLANGILQTHFLCDKLQHENKRFREELERLSSVVGEEDHEIIEKTLKEL